MNFLSSHLKLAALDQAAEVGSTAENVQHLDHDTWFHQHLHVTCNMKKSKVGKPHERLVVGVLQLHANSSEVRTDCNLRIQQAW
jgi:hypothetical protein